METNIRNVARTILVCSKSIQTFCSDASHKSSVNSIDFHVSPEAPLNAMQLASLSHNHPVGLHLAAGSQDGNVSVHSLLVDGCWSRKIVGLHLGSVNCVKWAPFEPSKGRRTSTDPQLSLYPIHKLASGGLDGAVRLSI